MALVAPDLGSHELAAVLAAVALIIGPEVSRICSKFVSVSSCLDGSITSGTGAGASATTGSSILASSSGSGTASILAGSAAGGDSTFSGSAATSGTGSGALNITSALEQPSRILVELTSQLELGPSLELELELA